MAKRKPKPAPQPTPIQRAVTAAGGITKLAARMTEVGDREASKQLVWNWVQRDRVPPEWVIQMEKALAGTADALTRHQIRPDIYPIEKG